MRRALVLTALFSAALAGSALLSHAQPSTQPSTATPVATPVTAGNIESKAQQALAANDYATALPLLRRMADLYKDDPRKLKGINEQIAACEKGITAGGPPLPEVRKPITLPKEGETIEFTSIKDLGNFEYDAEKGGGIPTDVKALSGKTIKLHGFMIPMDNVENITNFALVPSLFSCCFGAPPQIQHTVVVATPKGKSVSYYPDEIIVEGKLKVDEKKEDGFIVSVFELTAQSVKPASK